MSLCHVRAKVKWVPRGIIKNAFLLSSTKKISEIKLNNTNRKQPSV